jgi:vesicle-fusing ATPase
MQRTKIRVVFRLDLGRWALVGFGLAPELRVRHNNLSRTFGRQTMKTLFDPPLKKVGRCRSCKLITQFFTGLHIIIFDEIDAICKARGSVAGNSGVNDTVVNQLLSKIDGVDQLNNILIIGMTNRKDMIDDALLRPGRLEVPIEIGLPKENGRMQILTIHTTKMRENGKMSGDIDLAELSKVTKNFSGAELEGLVRAAQSCALNRLVKANSKVEIDPDAAEKLVVTRKDFLHALANDVKPMFGASEEVLEGFLARGIMNWGEPVQSVLDDGALLINQAASTDGTGLVSILLEGSPNAGKTALGAQLAKNSGFPFVKICSPEDMIGFTESAKCMQIRRIFDDAYRSSMSCILVDNIERLLDYGPIGPRYSNLTLQAILVLLNKNPPKGKRLLVICTTSRKEVLQQMEMISAFTDVLHVGNLTQPKHFRAILKQNQLFNDTETEKIIQKLEGYKKISIGIKKLLGLLDMIKQMGSQNRVAKFIGKLEDEEYIRHTLD